MMSNKVAAGRMRRVCRAGLLWVCLLGLAVSCRSGQQGQALVPGTPAYRYDRLYQEARGAQQEQRYEAAIRLFRQCLAWPEGPADSLEALDYQASVTGTLQQLMNTYMSYVSMSVHFPSIFHFSQFLVGLLDFLAQSGLVFGQSLRHLLIGQGYHFHGQYGGIHRTVDAHRGHRNAGRHLDDAQHGVQSVEHTLDGHADYGQGG